MAPRSFPGRSLALLAVLCCCAPAAAADRMKAAARHWAYQPITRPAVPRVKRPAWVRNPIDAFIAARHEREELTPAAEAPRRVLIRRLSLDLTGLPPTPAEVDAFLRDPSPNAYEKVVDRLLASPHYGERWGRHWLDLARWAESEGYESNHPRAFAYHYRDYVVRSFNDDKPYARFVREQVAGDEMLPYRDENLIATGFLAAGRLSSNEEDRARQRNDVLVDVVNATAATFLGVTLNCCQCHNHKFDAFSARDYYRFMGFFLQGQPANLALKDPALRARYKAARPPEYEPARKLLDTLLDGARARLTAAADRRLTPAMRAALAIPEDRRTPAQEERARQAEQKFVFGTGDIERAIRPEDRALYLELKKKLASLEERMLPRPQTFGFYSPVTSPTRVEVLPMLGFYPLPYDPKRLAAARPRLLRGGDVHRRGPFLDVGWPAIFGPTPPEAVRRTPRLALADFLTSPRNPLTARVWVNRLWQYHFGRGLVASASDFGVRGTPPSHPELLDWLAGELQRSGGRAKHLHRLIVCSSTYRQSSRFAVANARKDPDNRLLSRWAPRRLEAETIRDAMLAVSGTLDRRLGGPSIPDRPDVVRRTLYLVQKREAPPAIQSLFDGPSAVAESCPRRNVSTVPLQSLYLLNNDFVMRQARVLSRRVTERAGEDRPRQIEVAFLLALGRPPDAEERDAARGFFAAHRGDSPPALVAFCQALLNVNEFMYLE